MAFTGEDIEKVWKKGRSVEGYDKNKYRKDACGAWMEKDKYGDENSSLGWEIDHIKPKEMLDGMPAERVDNIVNLRPMNWANNRSKSDDYPWYYSARVSLEDKNIKSKRLFRVNKAMCLIIETFFKGGQQ